MQTLDRRTLLAGSAGMLGLGLLTLAGCATGAPTPSPGPSTDGLEPIEDTLPDLTLTRLFGQEVTPSTAFYAMALAGDHVLVYDDSGAIDGRLLALDATTGATAWSFASVEPAITAFDPQASAFAPSSLVLAGGDDDRLLLATTYVNPCPDDAGICASSQTDVTEGHGIAAIDVASGAVRWHALVLPPIDRSDPASTIADRSTVEPIGGTATIAVVRAGLSELVVLPGGDAPTREDRARTVGLSVADGSIAWERPGLVATAVTDVVVAMRRAAGILIDVVLDAETGEDLWETEPGTRVVATGAGMLAVGDETRTMLVDAATGDVLAEVPTDTADAMQPIGDVRIGTDVDGGALAMWPAKMPDLESTESAWRIWSSTGDEARPSAERSSAMVLLQAVDAGYAWTSIDVDTLVARDRSGAERCEVQRGFLRGVVGSRMLVQTDAGFDVLEIS